MHLVLGVEVFLIIFNPKSKYFKALLILLSSSMLISSYNL